MAGKQLIHVRDEYDSVKTIPDDILIKLFMRQSQVILKKALSFDQSDNGYMLRPAPYEGLQLDYSEQVSIDTLQDFELKDSLAAMISDTPLGGITEDHIILVAHQPDDPARVVPIPRKIPVRPAGRDIADEKASKQVAVMGNTLTSVSLATQPSWNSTIKLKPQIHATDYIQLLNYISIDLNPKQQVLSLPVVGDNQARYWPDRRNPQKYWYAPAFSLIVPALNADPATSPFQFFYESGGATNTGRPALKGTLRFTLERSKDEETAAALSTHGITDAQAVPFSTLMVTVLVPFVDEADGATKQHLFLATVSEKDNQILAEVQLLNDWVRLAYGALAVEGFQSLPVTIQAAYSFACYTIVKDQELNVVFGAKSLATPVFYTQEEPAKMKGSSYINAAALIHVHPLSTQQFHREAAFSNKEFDRAARSPVTMVTAKPYLHEEFAKPATNFSRPAILSQVVLHEELITAIQPVQYGLRTQVAQKTLPLIYPCNIFGNFYLEKKTDGDQSIGCQDAFKLGDIEYRQYEEIAELRDDKYFTVYRSLTQPGQFIVAPTRFCIGRREADEADAYKPLIFLNALIDPVTPLNNRVELRITLQPDIPVFKVLEITEKLKYFHPVPVISYPTDIANTGVNFNWAMDASVLATCQTDITDASGPFIRAYFSMDLPSWQLLKAVLQSPGLNGSVTMLLADGSQFTSNLMVKLDEVRGTWLHGPVQLTEAGGQTILTNKTGTMIDISDLVRYAGATIAEQIPVEVSLPAGEKHTVSAGPGLVPVFSYPLADPVAIEETRSFVEEIYSNFVLINLVNFDNYDLFRLDVEAKVRGIEGTFTGKLSNTERVIDFNYILPLTTFLDAHILDIQINKIFNNKPAELSAWMAWDLNSKGLIVDIDHSLLSL